jgi:hypothetical protein
MINVDHVPAVRRALLAELWQARAKSESTVRVVFDQLVGELAQAGAHADVIALARHAADDEERHARICHDLATAYRGTEAELVATPTARLPDYTSDVRLRAALHAINLCCISESLACAFVEACIGECDDSELRAVHGRHLADEVGHARVGWAHVASLSPEDKAAVGPFLVEILRAQIEGWESRVHTLPQDGVPGHGYPARDVIIGVIRAAVREIVLPGFAHVGIDASAAQAWFDAR